MSTTAEPRTQITPAELLERPDRDRYELIDGELVEKPVSALSSLVALKLGHRLVSHCEPTNLAWILGADCGYQCFPHKPGRVRKPDVSAIRTERLPVSGLDEGYVSIAPDLAVEVVSPNDTAYEIEDRVDDYLRAGTRLVWVVLPPWRRVQVHRGDGTRAILGEAEELSGEDVLPGFRLRVGDLFPAAAPAPGDVPASGPPHGA